LFAVGFAALAAGTVLLVVHLQGPQLPGQSISGSVDLNPSQQIEQQLAQATALANEGTTGSVARALTVYRRILSENPNQPQALAETGWLEWEAGAAGDHPKLVVDGKALVERSLRVKPDDYAGHFFLGTILLKQGDAAGAAAQYRTFLAQGPPQSEVVTAAPLVRQAFAAAGLSLPAGVPGS
jgi:cytochrome c-type biogenesis protein CcmH/NrfG